MHTRKEGNIMSDTTDNIKEENIEETSAKNDEQETVSENDIAAVREAEPDDIKEKPIDIKNEILEWMESFVFALLVVQLVFIFIFRIVMVDGKSMNNTLVHEDRLIMMHVNYTPEFDDIVVIKSKKENKILIKRVVGLAGDKVVVDYNENHVYVNDKQITNEHIKEIMHDSSYFDPSFCVGDGVYEYDVPEGCVFVMGDNRNDSKDSRSIGFITDEEVLGKAVFRIYPFNHIGKVS